MDDMPTGHRTTLALRGALLSVSMALLLASGGCAIFVKAPPAAADQTAPPPEADTITKLPPVQWKDLEEGPEEETAATPSLPVKPARPTSLWQRMRKHFDLPDVDNDRVTAKLNWYAAHPEYIERVAQRAKPYLYYIVEQLKARDMPIELALLPVVESAFDPFAYSRSGASGLWQFIPETGRRFGLRQNWWFDGRRDVVSSTRAALDYLQYLYGRFDNWMLALAAYNSGGGRVAWAIRKNKRHGEPTDFWHLDLPRQTRAYVPWLLAVCDVIKEPKKFGITLPDIPNKPYLAKISIKSQLDIARAAKMADLSLEQMYLLNAGFNRWATEPGQDHNILIPLSERADFVANLAALPDDNRVQWSHHQIARGDTLSSIANHYGTTVAVLEKVNQLDSSVIRAGHYLMVPDAATSLDQYAVNEIRQLRHDELAHQGRKIHYVVRPGDSLWAISRRFGVSTHQVAQWNHMSMRSTLHIGDKLVLWRRGSAPRVRKVDYVVRAGDSLWDISREYNVDVREIARWNGIGRNDTLHIGDKLTIWPHGHGEARAQTVSATGKDLLHKIQYTVRSGDSLWSISNQFNVNVNQLANWNSLSTSDYLHPGQQLVLYVNEQDASTQS
ncbi:MAG TPA: LysM peptidoglycan-binding domain-containing protein [Gammaproteobacteria bacterium]|nr:LysM peptidoglycan-binding domain-containing protein [Gammaproteobacteria bacterium]